MDFKNLALWSGTKATTGQDMEDSPNNYGIIKKCCRIAQTSAYPVTMYIFPSTVANP